MSFVRRRFTADPDLVRKTHRTIGTTVAAFCLSKKSDVLLQEDIQGLEEASHHLLQAGEYELAVDAAKQAAGGLLLHRRARDAVRLLDALTAATITDRLSKPGQIGFCDMLGRAYRDLGHFEEALRWQHRALELAETSNRVHDLYQVLGNLSNLHVTRQDYQQAYDYQMKARAVEFPEKTIEDRVRDLSNLSGIYHELGRDRDALDTALEAVRLSPQATRHMQQDAQMALAAAYAHGGEPSKAIGLYESAAAWAFGHEWDARALTALCNMARACEGAGDREKERKTWERALALARRLGDQEAELTCLVRMAGALADLGSHSEAIGVANEALRVARLLGKQETMAIALMRLGYLHQELGALPPAIESFEGSRDLWRGLGELERARVAQSAIAELLNEDGRPDEALAAYQAAVELARAGKPPGAEHIPLNSLGGLLFSAKDFDGAAKYFREAIEAARRAGAAEQLAGYFSNLGGACQGTGDLKAALAAWEEARLRFQQGNDHEAEARTLGYMLKASADAEVTRRALGHARRLLDDADQAGDAQRLVHYGWLFMGHAALSSLAVAAAPEFALRIVGPARSLNATKEERAALEILVTWHAKNGPAEDEPKHLQRLVELYGQQGDSKNARRHLRRLGGLHMAADRARDAADCYERSLALDDGTDPRGTLKEHCNLSAAFLILGHYDRALDQGLRAQMQAREISHRKWEASALLNIAQAHAYLGAPEKASAACAEAARMAREIGAAAIAEAAADLQVNVEDAGESRPARLVVLG